MLHGIGDVGLVTRDAGIGERLVEKRAGRTDKWLALKIFLVAGLLADEHRPRALRSFAEYRLRRVLIQVAAATFLRRLTECTETCGLRHKRRSGSLGLRHRSMVAG